MGTGFGGGDQESWEPISGIFKPCCLGVNVVQSKLKGTISDMFIDKMSLIRFVLYYKYFL